MKNLILNTKTDYLKFLAIALLALITLLMFGGTIYTNRNQDIFLLDFVNSTTLQIIKAVLLFTIFVFMTIIVPGKILNKKFLKDNIEAYFAPFIILFLLLTIRQKQIIPFFDYVFYLIYSSILVYFLLNFKKKDYNLKFNYDKKLLIGMLLFIIAFFYVFFKFPPYIDEFYRAQFVNSTMYYPDGKNILFYPDNSLTNYYILLEKLVGQISQLIFVDYKIMFFLFFPLVTILLIFKIITHFLKKDNRNMNIFVPLLFVALISFYWQSSVHLFLRQTANGFLFFLISIYLYKRFTQSGIYKEKIIAATFFGFSLLFVFYSKGMFGYAVTPIFVFIEIVRKKEKYWKDSIPLYASIIIVIYMILFVLNIKSNSESLKISFAPLFNFLASRAYRYNWLNPQLLSEQPQISVYILQIIITYLLIFNFQLVFLYKSIVENFKSLFKKEYSVYVQNNIDEVILLLTSIACFFIFMIFTISKYTNTGGADNYFIVLASYSIAVLSIIRISKLDNLKKYSMITIILIIAIFPLKHNFIRGSFSIKDREFIESLHILNDFEKGIVIHNIYVDQRSVAVSSLTPHKQYMSYLGYGGVYGKPEEAKEEKKNNIEEVINGKNPFELPEFNKNEIIYVLIDKVSEINISDSINIYENSKYSIYRYQNEK